MFLYKRYLNCVWLLILIAFICLANARQIRYSRYNTEVIENTPASHNSEKNINVQNNQTLDSENEIEATVREIKYHANSFRSMRAFPFSNETLAQAESSDFEVQVTEETLSAVTTENTKEYENETTTLSDSVEVNNHNGDHNVEKDVSSDSVKPNAPYPAAGFKPKIPFPLPTENLKEMVDTAELTEKSNETVTEIPIGVDIKTPYLAAGYRPSKAFLLPSEQLLLENEQEGDLKPKMGNNNHPPCGSSTNPLAPKPLGGEKEDPNSESIFGNTQDQQKRAIVLPVRYSVHPLLVTRPLIYGTPIISA